MKLSKYIDKNIYLKYFIYIFIVIILIFIIIQFILFIIYFIKFSKKYFFTKELNLLDRYGNNSWVIVTGSSSGQGRLLAIELAKKGFNILLIGSIKIYKTEQFIKNNYKVYTKCIVVNFSDAYIPDFFDKIDNTINSLNGEISMLVNNVAHRVAWNPYHETPPQKINDSIICGTIVQARMTQLAIQHFLKRKSNYKCGIVNITAMCSYPNIWFGQTNEISIPYLAVYEGANAFGFYHSNSIQKEYGDKFDILNIIPGAVITENTQYLKKFPFSVDSHIFVNNIIKLIGNYTGIQYAYWGHEISGLMSNFLINKDYIFKNIGKTISDEYMKNYDMNYTS